MNSKAPGGRSEIIAPERLSALRRVATIESIGSSTRIEGSKLTDREVERLLTNLEIKSFAYARRAGGRRLRRSDGTLFSGRGTRSRSPKTTSSNCIATCSCTATKTSGIAAATRPAPTTSLPSIEDGKQIGIVFETATPFDTPQLTTEIVAWFTAAIEEKRLHPLLIIAIFTVVFLAIHPFQDGNGRLSRIITTLILLRAGYAYVPYSSLESVIEQSKDGYYLALRQTQATIRNDNPDWEPWLLFFLRALRQQKERLAKKIEREKFVFSSLPEQSIRILDHAREHGRVSIGEIVKLPASAVTRSRSTSGNWSRRAICLSRVAAARPGTSCLD